MSQFSKEYAESPCLKRLSSTLPISAIYFSRFIGRKLLFQHSLYKGEFLNILASYFPVNSTNISLSKLSTKPWSTIEWYSFLFTYYSGFLFGAFIWMLQQSIVATACGKPDTLSNCWMIFLVSSLFGILTYVFSKFLLQIVCTTEHTVDLLVQTRQQSSRNHLLHWYNGMLQQV